MSTAQEISVCLIMTVQFLQCAFSLLCYETKIELPRKSRLTKCKDDLSVCYVVSMFGYFNKSGCSLKSGNFDGIGTNKGGLLYFCDTDGCNSEEIFLNIHRQNVKYSFPGLTIDDSASGISLKSAGENKQQKVTPRKRLRSRNKREQHPDARIDFVDYVLEDGAAIPRLPIATTACGVSMFLTYAHR